MMLPLRVAFAFFALSQPLAAQATALTHVNLVDVERGVIQRDQTIVIDKGRITIVGSAASVVLPKGTTQRNYAGRYVIPGLWDMHAHVGGTGRTALALYVANGVTGVRDMGSDRAITHAWRDSISRGLLVGPRLILAGPIVERDRWLTAVRKMAQETGDSSLMKDMKQRIPISTPESAPLVVDSVIALGGDFLKIRNDPAPASTFAMLRAARARKLDVAGHWPERISPLEASDSGYRSLEHGPLTVRNGTLVPTLDQLSADERRKLFAAFVRNGTAWTPTIVANKGMRLLAESTMVRLLADTLGRTEPRMRYVPMQMLRAWKTDVELMKKETGPPLDWVAFNKSWNRDLHDMAAAGGLILAGTDAGTAFVFPGFGVADELEDMVNDAGLTPLQALRAATLNVARWMRAERDFGTVTPGRRADLVVLDANPLEQIGNVRRISAVVKDGTLLDRAALDRLLASARH